MYDYVTKELPELVAGLFPVDPVKMSVTGTLFGHIIEYKIIDMDIS